MPINLLMPTHWVFQSDWSGRIKINLQIAGIDLQQMLTIFMLFISITLQCFAQYTQNTISRRVKSYVVLIDAMPMWQAGLHFFVENAYTSKLLQQNFNDIFIFQIATSVIIINVIFFSFCICIVVVERFTLEKSFLPSLIL